jgi:large subunit ribosomal protein L21
MYAIFQTGGKQYKVSEGDVIYIEKLDAEAETTVEFDQVLMVAKDDSVIVGNPTIEGAIITGKLERHGRGKKLVVYKYKKRKNYARKQGHRQPYSKVIIEKISVK